MLGAAMASIILLATLYGVSFALLARNVLLRRFLAAASSRSDQLWPLVLQLASNIDLLPLKSLGLPS